MQIYANLLAVCALHSQVLGTAAFFVQGPQSVKVSPLKSSYLDRLDGPNKDGKSLIGEKSSSTYEKAVLDGRARALEARLAALERDQTTGSRPRNYESLSSDRISPAIAISEKTDPVAVQGGSLKTWSFVSPAVKRVQVALMTEGRPLDADIQLWQGPDNTPEKLRVYTEDGAVRPVSVFIETPRGPNTVSIRNTGQLEFPLAAFVADSTPETTPIDTLGRDKKSSKIIQGGALRTYPFDPSVESVMVLLKTDGRPLNARIELLQGPNNIKQVIELYTEDGMNRPFYVVIECPGSGNVVRIVNTATVEFPLSAWVEPYKIGDAKDFTEPVISGESPFMVDREWGY